MNRIIRLSLSCLFFFFVATTSAGERDWAKFIGKYDVASEAKELPADSPEEFWKTAIRYNYSFGKFRKDIKKGRGAEKEALHRLAELPKLYPGFDMAILQDWQPYCDSLLNVMGITEVTTECRLYVMNTPLPDVYTMLTDNGFAICLTEGLLDMKGMNDRTVIGFVAHEFVHGVYKQHLQKFYQEAKKKRKDRLLEGMLFVGTVAAVTAVELTTPSPAHNGDTYYYEDNSEVTIINNPPAPMKYNFLFTEDQVLEVDLVAYRFMENLGCRNDYLDGLKILSPVYTERYAGSDIQPSITTRINFIEYLKQHPGLGLD